METFVPREAIPIFLDAQTEEMRLAVPLFRLREKKALSVLEEVWSNGPRIRAAPG